MDKIVYIFVLLILLADFGKTIMNIVKNKVKLFCVYSIITLSICITYVILLLIGYSTGLRWMFILEIIVLVLIIPYIVGEFLVLIKNFKQGFKNGRK